MSEGAIADRLLVAGSDVDFALPNLLAHLQFPTELSAREDLAADLVVGIDGHQFGEAFEHRSMRTPFHIDRMGDNHLNLTGLFRQILEVVRVGLCKRSRRGRSQRGKCRHCKDLSHLCLLLD